VIVCKVGGSLAELDALLADVARGPRPLVLVHGGNRELSELSTRLGHPPRMVTSERGEVSRYTDDVTMDHFLMTYCGKVNKRIVEKLQALGVRAVGLSAMDGPIARGRRKPVIRVREGDKLKVLRGDLAGSIEEVDVTLLRLLLDRDFLPVVCPPALSHEGEAINVDGDRLAMALAVALHAQRLVIFADTPGLLRDVTDESTLIAHLAPEEIEGAFAYARGRARTKLIAAREALAGGVGNVILADGRAPRPLTTALQGSGTWLGPAQRAVAG
jgi:acetylglutamate/LysW-gamma-L-alpha-aminoadipate kinase